MVPQRVGHGFVIESLEQHATVMLVIVLEPGERQDRRPNVGLVAEHVAEGA